VNAHRDVAQLRGSFKLGDRPTRVGSIACSHGDTFAGGETAGGYCVAGASVRGRLHQYEGTSRDDAMAVRFRAPWLVAAVSDGAGSCPLSHFGSSYAVDQLTQSLMKKVKRSPSNTPHQGRDSVAHSIFHELGNNESAAASPTNAEIDFTPHLEAAIKWAFQHTHRTLSLYAMREGLGLNELHCTLLGLALNVLTNDMVVGQIGDGAIVGLSSDGRVISFVEPAQNDDPAATNFITEPDWAVHFQCQVLWGDANPTMRTIFLMTDGVANDCQYGPPPDILERWVNGMDTQLRQVDSPAANASRISRYLQHYKAQGSFDDRTLVAVYRTGEGLGDDANR